MKKRILSTALIGCIAFVAFSWTTVQAPIQKTIVVETSWDDSYPIDETSFNSCTGEFVHYTGTMNDMGTYIEYDDGTSHTNYHYNNAGVTGVGQTSGDIYHLTGAGVQNSNFTSASAFTVQSNGNVTVQGMGLVSYLKISHHFTVNANGDVTRDYFDFQFECP
jgi:hypothetical protein